MQTQGDGGMGGGTGATMCAISPSDNVGTLGNILKRVEELELAVSQILGLDLIVGQLSEISQDMGNILGGTMSGAALAGIVTEIGKKNIWMTSGEDTVFDGQGETTVYGMGSIWEFSTSGSLNAFVGTASGAQYRFDRGIYQGGFYYETRVSFIPNTVSSPGDANDILPNCRFFAGLGTDLFRSFAGNNVDNPPCNYIVFSYSKPRGDATWKIMLNGKADVLASPDSAAVIDTGMAIQTRHWYDLKMRCEPGSGSITWEVTDVTTRTSVNGTVGAPAIYREDVSDPFTGGHISLADGTYQAGVGAFNCSTSLVNFGVHHSFAQILDVNTGQ